MTTTTAFTPGPGAYAMARELVHHIREAIGMVPGNHVVTLGQDVHDPAEGPWEFAEVAFVANNEIRKALREAGDDPERVVVVAPWYLTNGWEVQVRR